MAAQEGHPLTGTWSGDWVATADRRTRITLVMTWDGKSIAGTINPGPEAMTLGRVTVDYAKWTVRIEADGKDSSGKPVRVLADGKIDALGSWHRTLSGIIGSIRRGVGRRNALMRPRPRSRVSPSDPFPPSDSSMRCGVLPSRPSAPRAATPPRCELKYVRPRRGHW